MITLNKLQDYTTSVAPVSYIEDRVLELMQEADNFGYATVADGVFLNYDETLGYYVDKRNGYESCERLRFHEIVEEIEDYLIDEYQKNY